MQLILGTKERHESVGFLRNWRLLFSAKVKESSEHKTYSSLFIVSEENKDQSPTEDCGCTQRGLTTCCPHG